jgi:hypothetical protein
LTGPTRGQEGGREAASWSYSSGLQDQVSDLMGGGLKRGGQERGGKTSNRTHNPRIEYEVSDLMDEGQEGGGGQQPVGHTVMDFRIMSVTSWTEDRKEEVNICPTVLDFRIRSVTSWTKDRKEEVNSQLVLQFWTSGSGQ